MRMLIAVLFVLGCGAKHESTQPASRDDDANPNERITANALEAADEPDEQEEEPDEEEDPEEPDEQEEEQDDEEDPEEQEEEQDEDQMDDPEPDPEVSTSGSYFNYEEWTAEPPTYGKPKVPGPPYPHLEEDSRRGLYDQLRKYRWAWWDYERNSTNFFNALAEWRQNWADWKDDGGLVALAREFVRQSESKKFYKDCRRSFPVRKGDKTLEKLALKAKNASSSAKRSSSYMNSLEVETLGRLLGTYKETAAGVWFGQVRKLDIWKSPAYTKARNKYYENASIIFFLSLGHCRAACYSPSTVLPYDECVNRRINFPHRGLQVRYD